MPAVHIQFNIWRSFIQFFKFVFCFNTFFFVVICFNTFFFVVICFYIFFLLLVLLLLLTNIDLWNFL